MTSSDTEVDAPMKGCAVPVDSLSECNDTVQDEEARLQDVIQGMKVLGNGKAAALEEQAPFEAEDEPELHLPDGVVRILADHVVAQLAASSSSLFPLLSMCGTCRQWRSVVRELNSGSLLAYDGLDNVYSQPPNLTRFRKLPPAAKAEVFEAAASLFSGYTEVSFSGDGITDTVLKRVGANVGAGLTRCKLMNSSVVTDEGLRALLEPSTSLQHAHLEDLVKATSGEFLVDLFEKCTKLETVHLASMPFVNWTPCKLASRYWAPRTVTKLHVRGVNLDPEFGIVLARFPNLIELEIDGPARNLNAAAVTCPNIQRLSYQVASRGHLDEALTAFVNLPQLKSLELIVKNFTLFSDQLSVIGMLPLVEVRLDSFVFKQQPTLSRSSYSHIDNDGVKALVDSICNRWCATTTEMQPLKLSLCGATALTHDAVSALLRLPILTELDIGGCCRIIAMDKMRLVAKVRAGREMLESGRRPSIRNARFPGLFL